MVGWPDHSAIGTIMMEVRVEHLDVLGTIYYGLGVGAGNVHTRLMIVPRFDAGDHQVVDVSERIRIELVIASTAIDAIPRTVVHLEVFEADIPYGASLTAGLHTHWTEAEDVHDGPHILIR